MNSNTKPQEKSQTLDPRKAMQEARDYISNVNRFLDRQAVNVEPEQQGWALDNESEHGR